MRSVLLLGLIFAQLFWWDLLDKVRIAVSWDGAHRAIDRDIAGRAVRLLAIARLVVGLRVRSEIDERMIPRRFIVLANHQSLIDIVVIMAAFHSRSIRFVAKRELRRWFPAVSRVLRVQRHALISRHGDFATAMKEIERLGRTLRDNEGAVIFPEGTRSRDGIVHTFHSGAVRRLLAAEALPIVVIALDGGTGISHMDDLAGLRRGHEYRLKVLQVLPPATGKRALIAQIGHAQEIITDQLKRWRTAGKEAHSG
jgi:1-acyl-sn-glycerol-3-phosphate acyltransferase